jgi:hypothetical protein
MNPKVIIEKTFKVWVVIEEVTRFQNSSDTYELLENSYKDAGKFSDLEEAQEIAKKISKEYSGDFRKK